MSSNHIKAVANDIANDAVDSARDIAGQASDKAGAFVDQARDHLHKMTDELPDRASDAIAAGQRVYRQSQKTIGRQVAKQPIEALLLAGAIGYLVGWASNRT